MNAYDEKQYESYSYSLTAPAHLESLGSLFGLKPKKYTKARVLELGCALGGNIIPLASQYPEMEIVGIDYSKIQIEEARLQVKELGLTNISFQCCSILDFEDTGHFDYIICHGVYSWVDERVRKKILELTRDLLASSGIACVSYNTMPAWNSVLAVREMMKFHVRKFESAEEKIAQSRHLMNFIANGLEQEETPYAKFLKDELKVISNASDSYIYHEYLEEVNAPVYFHQFIQQCNEHGLSYLSDSEVSGMFAGNLKESFSEKLFQIKDIVRMGQYMDFIRNRRFRATLICKSQNTINRNLDVTCVEKYCLSYVGQFQEIIPLDKILTNETITYQGQGMVLTLQNPISKACIKVLHDNFGKPIAYTRLIKKIMKMINEKNRKKVIETVNQELNLMRLFLGGFVRLHTDEGMYTNKVETKPKTSPFIQKISKSKIKVPNLRHETQILQVIERVILQLIDGKKTMNDLNQELEKRIHNNEIVVSDANGDKVTDHKEIQRRLQEITSSTLESLAKRAYLLEADN